MDYDLWPHATYIQVTQTRITGPLKTATLSAEVRRGDKLKCRVCGLMGATIGCQIESCRSCLHYPCSLNSGCEVVNPIMHQVRSLNPKP